MENNISKIIDHLKNTLFNFLSPSDADEFIKAITVHIQSLSQPYSIESELDKRQIDQEYSDGVDERVVVDKIITLAERLLLKENYFNLILELARLMVKIGNQSFALEMLTDLKNSIGSSEYQLYYAEANLIISKIYWSQAQWEDCSYYIDQAYSSFKNIGFVRGYAKCENMMGTLYGEKGEFEAALKHFEAALDYLKESDDINTQAMILTNLGIIYTIYGNYEKAIWNYKDSIEKFKQLDDKARIARVYHNIGMLYTRMGEYYLALEHFNNSITMSIENNYPSNSAISYIGKAFIYTKLKNNQLADAFTDKAMEIACKLNDTLSIADIYRIKGIIHSNLNNFDLSEEFFETSIRLNDDFDSKYNKAESSQELGNLLNDNNKTEDAQNNLNAVEDYLKKIKK